MESDKNKKKPINYGEIAAPFVDMAFSHFPAVLSEVRFTQGTACGDFIKVTLSVFKDGQIHNISSNLCIFDYEGHRLSTTDVSAIKAKSMKEDMKNHLDELEIYYGSERDT